MDIDRYKSFIFEAPVSYDDDTDELADTNTKTSSGSPWVYPPDPNLSIPEVKKWVKENAKKNVFREISGVGATRIAMYNDGETVFKFNYKTEQAIAGANQIQNEVRVYNKTPANEKSLLPKFYRYGTNWIVMERIDEFTSDKLATLVDLTNYPEVLKNSAYLVEPFFKVLDYIFQTGGKEYVEFMMDSTYEESKQAFADAGNEKLFRNVKPWHFILLSNKDFQRVIRFCMKMDVTLADMKPKNLGFRGERLVIVDFGVSEKDLRI